MRTKRLSAHRRGYGRRWWAIRARILARDVTCRWPGCEVVASTVDHIVAKRDGGTDADSNLQALCQPHHDAKSQHERRVRRGQTFPDGLWATWAPDVTPSGTGGTRTHGTGREAASGHTSSAATGGGEG